MADPCSNPFRCIQIAVNRSRGRRAENCPALHVLPTPRDVGLPQRFSSRGITHSLRTAEHMGMLPAPLNSGLPGCRPSIVCHTQEHVAIAQLSPCGPPLWGVVSNLSFKDSGRHTGQHQN